MIDVGELPKPKMSSPLETADGKSIYLFRYDNSDAPNRNSNSEVSHEDLLGTWFTDSLNSLETYILMRPPGGVIKIVRVEKNRLEELKAQTHPIAKEMDIGRGEYILPDELLTTAEVVPLDIQTEGSKKFLFKEREKIEKFIEGLAEDITRGQTAS